MLKDVQGSFVLKQKAKKVWSHRHREANRLQILIIIESIPYFEYPVAVMMGTATMTRPDALQRYFIRNCSSMTYHSLLNRIRLICSDSAV